MGNSASAASTRRRLGDAVRTNVFQRSYPEPLKPHEIETLNKLAEREQERLSDLPSLEQINRKDATLGGFLNKLGLSISGRAIDVGGRSNGKGDVAAKEQLHAGPSGQGTPQQRGRAAAAAFSAAQQADESDRAPSFMLRQVLEARNMAEKSGGGFDVKEAAHSISVDPAQLDQLMRHACIPDVSKIETFGHQYAFARPPRWWRNDGSSGQRFKSEPWAKMIKPPRGSSGGGPGGAPPGAIG